jgi:hypothetical protein
MTDRTTFRSWAEDYPHAGRAMPPIDREAFRIRAIQRANGRAQRSGNFPPMVKQRGRFRDTRANSIRAAVANQDAETAARIRRETDEVERARLHLQRRGYVIVRATVLGGPVGRWDIAGRERWLTDAEMTALAIRQGFIPAAPERDAAPSPDNVGDRA